MRFYVLLGLASGIVLVAIGLVCIADRVSHTMERKELEQYYKQTYRGQ